MPPKARSSNNKKKKAAGKTGKAKVTRKVGHPCTHGAIKPVPGSPTDQALTFFKTHNTLPPMEMADKLIKECPNCVNQHTVDLLASITATCVVVGSEDVHMLAMELAAPVLSVLESLLASDFDLEKDPAAFNQHMIRYLRTLEKLDSRRSLIKFFAKRIPCNCLDQFVEESKDERAGKCSMCCKTTDALFNCSACNFIKYCSKECQVQHWPQHKILCKQWREKNFVPLPEGDDDNGSINNKNKNSSGGDDDSKPKAI